MAQMKHPPTVRRPDQGMAIAVVGDVYRFLATGDETDGRYAMFEAFVLPGGGPPPHTHSREEESFYVLEGETAAPLPMNAATATSTPAASVSTDGNRPATRPLYDRTRRLTARSRAASRSAGATALVAPDSPCEP